MYVVFSVAISFFLSTCSRVLQENHDGDSVIQFFQRKLQVGSLGYIKLLEGFHKVYRPSITPENVLDFCL